MSTAVSTAAGVRRRARRRTERGSMAIEVVILAPVLMLFVLLIVACGRYVAVRGDVEATARDAARAASLEISAGTARSVAGQVVSSSLDEPTSCSQVTLGGTWGAGGTAVVRLTCSVSYEGLGLIGVPGSVSINTESTVPLDPYRRYE